MLTVREDTLVLILVSEGLEDAFCDGLTVEDEAFCDRRLKNIKSEPIKFSFKSNFPFSFQGIYRSFK